MLPAKKHKLNMCLLYQKKGERESTLELVSYGRFLSNSKANNAPTKAIATIMPATAGTKYMSTIDDGGSVGEAVA